MSTFVEVEVRRLFLQGPQSLGCGTEVELNLWVDVTYDPGVSGSQLADEHSVEVTYAACDRAELTVGEVKLNLPLEEQCRLFSSWYRNPENVKRLNRRCASHWNDSTSG